MVGQTVNFTAMKDRAARLARNTYHVMLQGEPGSGKERLAHGMHHMQRCDGKYIHQAIEATGCTAADLVEQVRIVGLPRKVEPSGVVAGLAWPELQAQMERLKT